MEPVRDYELKAFFTYVIDVLERLSIPYMVVGGFAAIFYGEPRLTIDVDIVVDMKPEHIRPFVAAFPIPDYYVSEEGIRDSLRQCYPFNIIQTATGAKVDLVPLPRDPFTRLAFQRRQSLAYDEAGHSATFIAPADIILAKLIAFQQTGSDKHLRDARGVLVTQWGQLNLEAIRYGAQAAGVLEQFEELLEAARREIEG
jgi:hypothetical protein